MNQSMRLFIIDTNDIETIELMRGYPVASALELLDQFEFSSYVEMLEAMENMIDDK